MKRWPILGSQGTTQSDSIQGVDVRIICRTYGWNLTCKGVVLSIRYMYIMQKDRLSKVFIEVGYYEAINILVPY